MVKQVIPLPVNPGIYTEQTERGAVGYWRDGDKVRFRYGLPEKIGGWSQLSPSFLGTCRAMEDWSSLDAKRWTALGTEKKLYIWQDNTLFDITPVRSSGQLTNPFDTTNTSTTVTVNHTNHGAQNGDYVRFDNATAGGGITVDGEYEITVTDEDTYTITHTSAATSTATGTGGTVDYEYDISAGAATASTSSGYGTGGYGNEGYGDARTESTLVLSIRIWALDTWGEDLLACPRGGAIYHWDRSRGTSERAVLLANAPSINQYMIVSQRDRHVLALGAYDDIASQIDPLLIRWSSSEDLGDWTATSTNSSGDLRIYTGSKIVTAVQGRLETVIFTDVSVHTMPFVGSPDVFGLNTLGVNVSILGPKAATVVDGRVFFMAEADFYIYDGTLRVMPCTVRNFVYENLNTDQREKVCGGLNREFNEIWWFYPSYDPLAWVQTDFSLRLPTGYQLSQGSGTIGYSYTFNSGGFTEVTATADNNYEHDYVLTNNEPFLDVTESEYAVELDVNPDIGAGTARAGLCFLRTEVTGTADTDADDVNEWMVQLDYANDRVIIEKKEGASPTAPDNLGGNTSDFTTLTGAAMATGTKYVIDVQFDTPQITVRVDGNQAFQFDMSAAELALFTDGTAGLHQSPGTADEQYRFYNFAASPLNVITASDFDISPIEVNRYVAYNYEEKHWTLGKLARTAWQDRSPTLESLCGKRGRLSVSA